MSERQTDAGCLWQKDWQSDRRFGGCGETAAVGTDKPDGRVGVWEFGREAGPGRDPRRSDEWGFDRHGVGAWEFGRGRGRSGRGARPGSGAGDWRSGWGCLGGVGLGGRHGVRQVGEWGQAGGSDGRSQAGGVRRERSGGGRASREELRGGG